MTTVRQVIFAFVKRLVGKGVERLEMPTAEKSTMRGSSYEVFLSYSSTDHGVVEEIAEDLRHRGVKPFLDRWALEPGIPWRPKLEEALRSCDAVAIFVGQGEMGPWQQREVDVALDLQSKRPKLPVIPILLPGSEPPLGFLGQLTWVDLRTLARDRGVEILAKAARGEVPSPDLLKHLQEVRISICPYRGLLHFREEDAPFFFGREEAVKQLAVAVQRGPFVAVVGASGSGKSSVVRAGLVPRLRSDRRTAWGTVILVPTDKPLNALAKALLVLLEPGMSEVERLAESAKLADHFLSGTISLYDIIERILEKQPGTNRVLILVDQFEELFTLVPDEEARRLLTSDEEASRRLTLEEEGRRRFLDELLVTSSRPGSRANVVLTLRGDFVGKALAYRPLSNRLQNAQINLGPMTREELERAIRKPAEKIQLEFEPGLVERILAEVGDQPGNLPLLEFVLKELWDKRRGRVLLNETYDAIGGLQGAVATKADELLNDLSPAEQKILQRVFLRIVRPSESGLDTRRRAAFTELPPEGVQLVVRLAKERLLVTSKSETSLEQTVEVAHEALISNWGTLRTWVKLDREFLLWRDRLDTLFKEWERSQESNETLLRGPLLIEAQKWFDRRSEDLSNQEQKFISASREEKERLAREEKERQERELEAAQRLARAEALRAKDAEERRREQVEAAQKLAEEQKQRAELSEQREKEQKETAKNLRRQAFVARGAAAAAIFLLFLSVFLWRSSVQQADVSQHALADSFFRTIGVSDARIPTRDEREALWELAQLDHANAVVRDKLLSRWFGTDETFERGEVRHGQGFRAATGLNMDYHRLATRNAANLGRRLAAALENPKETNPNRLSSLGNALAALANRMEPQPAAEIAKGLAAALENLQEIDPNRLSSLGNALAALANKTEPQTAAEIAKGLATALENIQETDPNRLSSLGNALAALANKIKPQPATEIVKSLAAALENPRDTDSNRLSSLGNALAALANEMELQPAAEVARPGARRLAATLENIQETDPNRLWSLGNALAALASKTEPQTATEIAKGLATALENIQETDSNRLSSLGNVLGTFANKMEPQATAEIARSGAQRLAAALENPQETDPDRLSSLGNVLAALANNIEPQPTAEIAKGLVAALENPKETDPNRLWSLGNALAALANKMEPQPAAEIAKSLGAALENPKETDPNRLSSLGNALAALTNRMNPHPAAEIARSAVQRLVAALKNPQETDPDRLSNLGNVLATLANKMEPQPAAEIAKSLAAALENSQETDPNRLWSLGNVLAALANKIEPQAASEIAEGLAEAALKNPQETDSYRLSSLGDAMAALANKIEPQAAAEIAKGLATALENPQEMDSDRLSSLGETLAAFCALLPSAHHTQLLALSNMLLQPVHEGAAEGKERPHDRELLANVCAQLPKEDVVEVLKYPFCTGEAEQIVLKQLNSKTHQEFSGDVWKFVEQADSLGVRGIDADAERPLVNGAIEELRALQTGSRSADGE